jgi:hypothetical protein
MVGNWTASLPNCQDVVPVSRLLNSRIATAANMRYELRAPKRRCEHVMTESLIVEANVEKSGTSLTRRRTAEVAVSLAVDDDAVDAAVKEINKAYITGNLATARMIGGIIVERFFGGDLQSFHAGHRKNLTYRQLAKHPNLAPSTSSLWYSVAVYEHFRELDEAVAGALSLAHHRLLAHVEADTRTALATRVIAEGLTVADLKISIRQAAPAPAPDQKKRGRPPIPAVVKGLSQATKALVALGQDVLGDAELSGLDASQHAQALVDAQQIADQALAFVARLTARSVAGRG